MEYNKKTIGPKMARLVAGLYDRSLSTFSLRDVERILGQGPAQASNLLRKAVGRGLVTRIKGGLFTLIPQELGSAGNYLGSPYLVGKELAGGSACFVSHASAMDLHRMTTQPPLGVYFSCAKRIRSRTVQGTQFRFVRVSPHQGFGTIRHWITKQDWVEVSDLERTVIDGLRQPQYCGGITEVAKGLWMRHGDLRVPRLLEYAQRLENGAVQRRLGYLLELYALGDTADLERHRRRLTATYVVLDPLLPKEGEFLSRWKLQLNVSAEELRRVRGA